MLVGAGSGEEAAKPVILQYRLESGEAVVANRLWAQVRLLRPMWYLLAIVFPLWGWISFARKGLHLWVYPAWLAVVAAGLGFWYLLVWCCLDLLARWKVHHSAARIDVDEVCFVLDSHSVTLQTAPITQRIDWTATRGFLLTERFVFIRITSRVVCYIPTRVCDPEQLRAVVRAAPEWLLILRRRPFRPHEVIRRGTLRRPASLDGHPSPT